MASGKFRNVDTRLSDLVARTYKKYLYILRCQFNRILLPVFLIVDSPVMQQLADQADKRIATGLRPRTATAYLMTFKLFLAFMVYMNITIPHAPRTIIVYLEYIAQNNLKIASLSNHVSVLKHYFGLFGWPISAFASRKVQLLLKSVQMNAKMQVSVKGVISIALLKKLVEYARKLHNGQVFSALFLTSFFGFFRLASLIPPSVQQFDRTRFPVVGDLIWGSPGVHIIMTCAKNMQTAGKIQVVQLPTLQKSHLCPVQALKTMLLDRKDSSKDSPLFQIRTKKGWVPLIAIKVRSFFKTCIVGLGLNPKEYTFHAFRRSGASFAFDNNVSLTAIKQHGNWRSEAVWSYLNSTPKAASTIPTTFQKLLS